MIPIARADLALRERGDTKPLRDALRQVPKDFDPGGAITTIAVRVALMERDYDEAVRALGTCSECKYNDIGLCGHVGALDDYTVPRDWYVGLIARGQGKEEEAKRAFVAAREAVLAEAVESPNDAKILVMRGLIDAMLGRTDEALVAGRRAAELLPISADAIDGPLIATNLAAIYAQLGHRDEALETLESAASQTAGPTPGTLRAEPQWDPLREDPRFQKLL